MQLQPRNEWVLIRRIQDGEHMTDGGIIVPEDQKRSTQGIVEAVGPKVYDLTVGSKVVFTNFPMDIDGLDGDLALVREEEVYGLLV
jgi:co-chaperonin GroES (HSP10)